MDQLDRQILDALQMDYPLSEHPYAVIAEPLGRTEGEVWQRVQGLLESGIIRRLGASLDSRRLGYASTLVGIAVPPEELGRAQEVIHPYPEVTHCYQRRDTYNIWFTLIACSQARITEILGEIQAALDLSDEQVLNAPVERLFKLDARFRAETPGPSVT